jgi:hypothetical protein
METLYMLYTVVNVRADSCFQLTSKKWAGYLRAIGLG